MKQTRATILASIEGYLKASNMSEREFGMQALNDGKFIPRLRRGYGVTLTSIERAEAFIENNPPAGTIPQTTNLNHPPAGVTPSSEQEGAAS